MALQQLSERRLSVITGEKWKIRAFQRARHADKRTFPLGEEGNGKPPHSSFYLVKPLEVQTSLSAVDLNNNNIKIALEQEDFDENMTIVNIKEIRGDLLKQRINTLKNHFKKKFNKEPSDIIRVPGRVNLIGEHIDYCGFPVCPMALDKDILIAVAKDERIKPFLTVTNIDSIKYPDFTVAEYKPKLQISISMGWGAYVLCGIQGFLDFNTTTMAFNIPYSLSMAVSGNIPPCAGLSSSSALVVASFLAPLRVHDIDLPKTKMANMCSEAEHYIGTFGGGMDQAIALNGKKGCAKMIQFDPLKFTDIILPAGAILIIANSLTEKNKAASYDFNLRVVECRIAAQMLAKFGGIENWKEKRQLHAAKTAVDCSTAEVLTLVDKLFHEEPYTKQEICSILEISEEELIKSTFTPDTKDLNEFKIKQRATHVFGEAERVYLWRNWCHAGKSLEEIGSLMTRSHNSLQFLFECSHPDVDKLVSIFMYSGAYGARVTGAGWGGCAVALSCQSRIPKIMENLYDMYYKSRDVDIASAVFTAMPGGGAEIISLANQGN